jgi:hypothetical protein
LEPLSGDPTLPREQAVDPEFTGTGRFLIRRRIGAGSFGVVYQVYDREWDAVVALKALKRVVPEDLYRFKLEFRSLAELSHPNLVQLHELFFEGGAWFFTMEYIEGTDFIGHVRGRDDPGTRPDGATPPTPEELLRLRRSLAQLGRGLSFLHRSRLLHRDLKPSNVVVSTEERVILVDFGLLEDLASKDATTSGLVVGTPAYMAPEQACGLPVSEASDWYSVGVMLYEALVGRHPFRGYAREDLVRRERPIPAPGELVPGIPEDLSGLCMDLLDRDPGRRPGGQEVLERLGSAGDGETASRSGPPPGPAWIAAPGAPASEPFVGREECLFELAEAFRAVQRGQSVAQFVHSSSGMGKTTLVQHFIEKLHERERAVVLAGRCFERESVPFKALDSLLDALSRYLGSDHAVEVLMPRHVGALSRIFPVLKSVPTIAAASLDGGDAPDDQEMRRRAFIALRELLVRIAMRVPVVLFIDMTCTGVTWTARSSCSSSSVLRSPPLLLIACTTVPGRPRVLPEHPLHVEADPSSRHLLRWLAVEELSREESRDRRRPAVPTRSGAMAQTRTIVEVGRNRCSSVKLTVTSARSPQPPTLWSAALDEVLWRRCLSFAPSRKLLEIGRAGRPFPSRSPSAPRAWRRRRLETLRRCTQPLRPTAASGRSSRPGPDPGNGRRSPSRD